MKQEGREYMKTNLAVWEVLSHFLILTWTVPRCHFNDIATIFSKGKNLQNTGHDG